MKKLFCVLILTFALVFALSSCELLDRLPFGKKNCEHVYDNACDSNCNVCGEVRTTLHAYDNACDADCNVCGAKRTPSEHNFDDNICVECGYRFTKGLKYTLNKDGVSYSVVGIGSATDTDVVIPAIYEGKPVTSIGDRAFYDFDSLTSVVIGDSVETIGNYAFRGCINLSEITLGESLASIGKYAFGDCDSLTSVVIPDSVTTIGDGAFSGCSSLTSVYISDIASWCNILFGNEHSNPLRYANNLYLNGELVTELVIPEGVTSIGDCAFSDCYSLTSVVIPDSVTYIGDYAFSGCYKLVEVINKSSLNITAGSTSNGSVARYAIEVHRGESKIVNADNYLFYTYNGTNFLVGYVGNEKDITLPERYNGENYEIYNYAFRNCTSLTSVVIPDSVETIGDYAFLACTNLSEITLGESLTSIGSQAFYNCYKLVEVINKSSLNIRRSSSDYGYVGYYAIEIHSGESKIVNVDDYLFYTYNGRNYLVGYVGNETDITLPESYNGENYEIYQHAFRNCTSLISVEIGDSVEMIGNFAFEGCRNLSEITLGESLTSIGYYAFYNCTSLTSVVIGDSVEMIGSGAFEGCRNLSEITLGESLISIGKYAFSYCYSLTSVVIPDSVTSIGSWAFEYCSSLTSVVIGNGVEVIVSDAFYECTSLTSVVIGDSVTSIGDYAFWYCRSLTSIKYRGTEAEWNAIEKGDSWDSVTGNYTITYNYTGE